MTKTELINEIKRRLPVGFHTKGIYETLKTLGEVTQRELSAGRDISLPGIGTMKVVDRPARIGRNPKTGEKIDIPAKKAIKFRAVKALKDAVVG
jgi:DNA-binding protein HU-beta